MKIDGVVGVELESRLVAIVDPESFSYQQRRSGVRLDFSDGRQIWFPISAEKDVELVRVSLSHP